MQVQRKSHGDFEGVYILRDLKEATAADILKLKVGAAASTAHFASRPRMSSTACTRMYAYFSAHARMQEYASRPEELVALVGKVEDENASLPIDTALWAASHEFQKMYVRSAPQVRFANKNQNFVLVHQACHYEILGSALCHGLCRGAKVLDNKRIWIFTCDDSPNANRIAAATRAKVCVRACA
ncbi:hypothetical protein EON66_03165 [archaeon]|nr:MAG: hypothetical protein EON66_03165 [archaeon]